MAEWPEVTVEELAAPGKNSLATGPFGSAIGSRFFRDSGVPVIRGSNLSLDVGQRLVDEDIVFVDDSKAKEFPRSVTKNGDLVFTCWGTIGQVGLVDERARYGSYIVSNKQMKLTPDPKVADSLFLYYAFSAPSAVGQVQGATIGSSVPGFNLTQLRTIRIQCPPLAEQKAVAATLGALDDKIAVNERIAATHEALMAQRFVKLTRHAAAREVLASRLVEFGPKELKPTNSEAVYVDMAALSTVSADIDGWIRRAPKGGTRFRNGDTLLARITPCLENGKTGYVDFMDEGEVGVGSTEFIVMRARPGFPKEISYFLARSADFRENAIRKMVGSSGRQRVSAADASQFSLQFPDDEAMLAEFGEAASTWSAHKKALASESRTLAALRDTLLPQLMSGKLRVRDAERIVEDAV